MTAFHLIALKTPESRLFTSLPLSPTTVLWLSASSHSGLILTKYLPALGFCTRLSLCLECLSSPLSPGICFLILKVLGQMSPTPGSLPQCRSICRSPGFHVPVSEGCCFQCNFTSTQGTPDPHLAPALAGEHPVGLGLLWASVSCTSAISMAGFPGCGQMDEWMDGWVGGWMDG